MYFKKTKLSFMLLQTIEFDKIKNCFLGHLDFAGDSTWIYSKMKPYQVHDYSKWQEVPAVRTKVGTYPPGSEWAKIISPYVDKASTYY